MHHYAPISRLTHTQCATIRMIPVVENEIFTKETDYGDVSYGLSLMG